MAWAQQTPNPTTPSTTTPSVCAGATVTFSSQYSGSSSTRATDAQWEFRATGSTSWTPLVPGGNISVVSVPVQGNNFRSTLTLSNVTGGQSGSYRVTFSPFGGQTTSVGTLSVTPVPTVSGTLTVCNGSSTTLTATNGTSSSFKWYASSTGGTAITTGVSNNGLNFTISPTNITTTTITDYYVAAVGPNNCETTPRTKVTVTLNPTPATPTISIPAGGSTTICEGQTVTLISSPAASYAWSNGATTQSITVDRPGNYTVTVGNGTGCTAISAATTITVNPVPTTPIINASGPTTFCTGGSVTLTASEGTSYLWSNGATTRFINVSTAGNYSVNVYNASGCFATSAATTVTVNPLPTPTINASGPTTFCAGGSVTLTASEGASWLWSNGANTQSITVNEPGDYRVTVTNNNNCSAPSEIVTVRVNALPVPTITAGGAITFCQGGSVTLTASAGSSYLWSTGEITQSITVDESGAYTVQVTNTAGCTATSAATTVTVNELPTASITAGGPTTFCQGGSVLLTGNSDHANVTYTWYRGGLEVATGANYSANTSGSYTVVATDANTCSSEVSAAVAVTVIAPNNIIREGLTTSFCTGSSTILHALTGTGYVYVWTKVGDPLFTATGPELTVTDVGSYAVTLTTPAGCIITSDPTQVSANPLPVATITPGGPTTFCEGGSVILTASAGASWLWNTGATTQSIKVFAGGSYSVTVTNANECSATSDATPVTVNPLPEPPTITANGPTTFCFGGTVTLTASEGSSYLWSNGATTPSITVSATDNFTVQVTNANGCLSPASAVVAITVNQLPEATITANRSTALCQGETVILTASAGSSYLWNTGATTQSIEVSAEGSYSVTVTNANECSATSGATPVTVNPLPATPTITANGPTTFCADATVTLTASAGTSYLWSNGATSREITVNVGGNYTVNVFNENGCSSASAATPVTVYALPATPTILANGPTTFCTGGSVVLTASEGSSYLWSTSETTRSITVSRTGNYTVQVTNANSCFSAISAEQSVTVNTIPTAAITPSGATTFCQGGSVTLTASGGTSYRWSTGATSQAITVSAGGSYSVEVTANNCSASTATTVTVNPLPPTARLADFPGELCTSSGAFALTQGTPAGGVYSYLGSTSNVITQDESGQWFFHPDVAGTGQHCINYTVTNEFGCSTVSEVKCINVKITPLAPTFTGVNAGDTFFSGEGVRTLTSGQLEQGTNGVFSGPGVSNTTTRNGVASATFNPCAAFNEATAGNSDATFADVTITYSVSNGNQCSNSITKTVRVNKSVYQAVVTSNIKPFCKGDKVAHTVRLYREAVVIYPYLTNAAGQPIRLDGTPVGPQEFPVSNPAYPFPVGTTEAAKLLAWRFFNPVVVSGTEITSGLTYQWNKNQKEKGNGELGGQGADTRVFENAGLSSLDYYSSYVTANSSCPSVSDLVSSRTYTGQLTGYAISLEANKNPICPGDEVTFTAVLNNTFEIAWSSINLQLNWIKVTATGVRTVLQTTSYTGTDEERAAALQYKTTTLQNGDRISIEFTSDLNGAYAGSRCSDDVVPTNVITMVVAINQGLANINYCAGGTGTIRMNGSQDGIFYQLLLDGSPVVGKLVAGTGSRIDFTGLTTAGSYSVRAIVSGNDCLTYGPITLVENPLPTAAIGAGTYTKCVTSPTTTFTLNGSSSNGNSIWSRVSSTGTAAIASFVNANAATTDVNISGTGTITLRLTTNSNVNPVCTSASATITLTINPLPTSRASADAATKCANGTGDEAATTFSLTGTITNGNPVWTVFSNPSNLRVVIANPNQANSAVAIYGSGTVTMRLTANSNQTPGCGTATSDLVLTVTPSYINALHPTNPITLPNELLYFQPATFTANPANTALAWTYNWTIVYVNDVRVSPQDNNLDAILNLTAQEVNMDFIGVEFVQVAPDGIPCVAKNSQLGQSLNTPQPVELLYLKADKKENGLVLVEWSTAMEKNSEGFEVQVSQDAKNYRSLGFVASQNGNSTQQQKYEFYDKENGKYGTRYYRLKQVDLDGTSEFFGPKAVKMGDLVESISAYPNPFTSEITLEINAEEAGTAHVTIHNAVGSKVLERTLQVQKGMNKQELQLNAGLPLGVYTITTRINGRVSHFKLLKQ